MSIPEKVSAAISAQGLRPEEALSQPKRLFAARQHDSPTSSGQWQAGSPASQPNGQTSGGTSSQLSGNSSAIFRQYVCLSVGQASQRSLAAPCGQQSPALLPRFAWVSQRRLARPARARLPVSLSASQVASLWPCPWSLVSVGFLLDALFVPKYCKCCSFRKPQLVSADMGMQFFVNHN